MSNTATTGQERLTTAQAAALVGRNGRTILRWITSGRLHGEKLDPALRTSPYTVDRKELLEVSVAVDALDADEAQQLLDEQVA